LALEGRGNGGVGELHNEMFNDQYSSPNIRWVIKIEKNEMGGTCSAYGDRRGVYRVLVGKPDGKRSLGRPGLRWKDHIKIALQEGDVGVWTGSSWLRIGTGGGHL